MFISRKKRRWTQAPFAFVRFFQKGGAQRAITNLNRVEIRGCKLMVSENIFKCNLGREQRNNIVQNQKEQEGGARGGKKKESCGWKNIQRCGEQYNTTKKNGDSNST